MSVRKDRFAYNEYIERKSILDQIYTDSSISQSPFRGILRLLLIIGFMFVLNNIVVRYKHANEKIIVTSLHGRQVDVF